MGVKFAEAEFGTASLDKLRALPADQLLKASLTYDTSQFVPAFRSPNIDGYFLAESPTKTYEEGRQARVPLLAGWNADEGRYQFLFQHDKPTKENYIRIVHQRFGENADELLKLYPAETDAQAKAAARDVVGDAILSRLGMWKWIELHRIADAPVYRYEFDEAIPPAVDAPSWRAEPAAYHTAEIPFVFRNLSSDHRPWRKQDHELSDLISSYWTNFARTGDPNGPGLPKWPAYARRTGFQVMHFGANSRAVPDAHRDRYEFLDKLSRAGALPYQGSSTSRQEMK